MKVERFIVEYANNRRARIENNELMNPGIKAEIIRRIDMAIKAREKQFITIDEAINLIHGTDGEDMSQYMTA